MAKKRNPEEFDAEATKRLADAIRHIGFSWGRNMKLQEARSFLKEIEEALSDGANPEPVDRVPLISVLCAYPFEKSAALLRTIRTAVALGADVERPLIDTQSVFPYTRVCSSIQPLASNVCSSLSKEEVKKRLDAVLSGMSASQMERIFVPNSLDKGNGYYMTEPLLNATASLERFRLLLDWAERTKDARTISNIVNAKIELHSEDGTSLSPADARAYFIGKGLMDHLRYHSIGNTPLHRCIELKAGNPDISETIERLVHDGACPISYNVRGLTPYELAYMKGAREASTPSKFGLDVHGLARIFSERDDSAGEPPIIRAMNGIRYSNDLQKLAYDEKFLDSIKMMLVVYKQCREYMPPAKQKELAEALSDTLAVVVARGDPFHSPNNIVSILLDAGADPRYAAPGNPPTWKMSADKYGPCSVTYSLIERVPEFSDTDMSWLVRHGMKRPHENEPEREVHDTETERGRE